MTNILHQKERGLPNSILHQISKTVEPVIKEILDSDVDKKNRKLVNYPVSAGGKRLRPALAVISCRMLGGKTKDVLYAAAGLEILHNYTLIIDDIIDNSDLRRGKPSTWFKFGKSMANCIGIDYGAAIFQAANKSKYPVRISEIFSETMKALVDGEILDILFEKEGREDEPYIVKNHYQTVTKKKYLEMVNKKTAALFQSSCEVGGICAGASFKELKALRNFGFNFGMAFQIKDDILDIFGEEKKFGKKIGHDIEEKKWSNIIILFALKKLNSFDKNQLSKILEKKKITKKDIRKSVKIIKKTNAADLSLEFGEKYIQKAKNNLDLLPQNKWNNLLREISEFAIEREK